MRTALMTALGIAAAYFLCGFIAWNWDASAWPVEGRFLSLPLLFLGAMFGWMAGESSAS